MTHQAKLTSSEIGTLWMTYQQKTMFLRIMEFFLEHAEREEEKQLLQYVYDVISPFPDRIAQFFTDEDGKAPIGFTSEDVSVGTPKLYDNGYDIMFIRVMKQISMGMHTLHLSMSYREDVCSLYRELTSITQEIYSKCTAYLIDNGQIARAPYVPMPKANYFVDDKKYLKGQSLLGDKRMLNTVELAHIYQGVESNTVGFIMIKSFHQVAKTDDIKKYFAEGMDLARDIIVKFTKEIEDSQLPAPTASGGNITNSVISPFSEKLMMYCTSLFSSFSLGKNAIGTAFSFRNDLPVEVTLIAKDIFDYAHSGARIMIKHGWLEEPPRIKDLH
ncbi:DUF3231 family protein [Mangrovibacillus cuniculi]|uniref:DUF3231 family protein n=1 Tax=Mangrovibacillus cuniculi TaxID=2593652 RepID=A0A7S8CDZ6_9BACI|nr:DUF3231 family protein [Mangrovibacillus cuniculi]QPC48146.1 DUF3231 family protein [Mangrovibacillus cuniculi]